MPLSSVLIRTVEHSQQSMELTFTLHSWGFAELSVFRLVANFTHV